MITRPLLRIVLAAIVAFALGLILARLFVRLREVPVPVTESATILPQPRELPPLDLVDQDGRPLPRDFLRNHWTIVFFGFTQCPDVCPTTLTTLAQMKKKLADLPAEQQPRVLLVTVDPERDTAAILKPYVTFFDPSILGATWTLAGTGQAASAFSIPFAKVPLPGGGYTMDHGAGLFMVSPRGALAAYSSPPLDATVLARDFRKVVQYFEASHR
jgi:protein SCO1/2